MKRTIFCAVLFFAFLCVSSSAHGVVGIPDQVTGSTLIVPFVEVGINSTTHPHDTLLAVNNINGSTSVTVHYELYDVFGSLTAVYGNFTLAPGDVQPFSLRALINAAPPATKALLTDGPYYRGFMTFDAVTTTTTLSPFETGYPFRTFNYLTGNVYYTRLTQGSSNGLPMLPIEAVPTASTNNLLWALYQCSATYCDNRERFDADSRWSVQALSEGGWPEINPLDAIYRVYGRIFMSPAYNSSSRMILFTFPDIEYNSCMGSSSCGPGSVLLRWFNEAGAVVWEGNINLDRIVNVINFSSTADTSGYVSVHNIPYWWHTYGFTFNSASPGFDPALTWDAIFEATILPYYPY